MSTIAVNTLTVQRVATVLPLVQDVVAEATDDYVYTGAVGVGLNRLFDPNFKFKASDFESVVFADDTVDVTIDPADSDRATSLAASLGVSVDVILSAALCTGMAKLVGDPVRLVGPFSEAV